MAIIIKSLKNGFRRCGIAHGDQPTRYEDGHFSAEQLAALQAEPMLLVEVVADEPAEPADKKPAADKKTLAAEAK